MDVDGGDPLPELENSAKTMKEWGYENPAQIARLRNAKSRQSAQQQVRDPRKKLGGWVSCMPKINANCCLREHLDAFKMNREQVDMVSILDAKSPKPPSVKYLDVCPNLETVAAPQKSLLESFKDQVAEFFSGSDALGNTFKAIFVIVVGLLVITLLLLCVRYCRYMSRKNALQRFIRERNQVINGKVRGSFKKNKGMQRTKTKAKTQERRWSGYNQNNRQFGGRDRPHNYNNKFPIGANYNTRNNGYSNNIRGGYRSGSHSPATGNVYRQANSAGFGGTGNWGRPGGY